MSIRIIKPGMLTTVQDGGRQGFQSFGVSVAGPMDRLSYRLANLLVGNSASEASLEVTLIGPEIEFKKNTIFAVTGAEFDLEVNDCKISMNTALRISRGSILSFGLRNRGARAYLAVAGGFNVPKVLGSRATHISSCLGGLSGRPLTANDCITIGTINNFFEELPVTRKPAIILPEGGSRLRVILGPHSDLFTSSSLDELSSKRYEITAQSNRMGYRLTGPGLNLVKKSVFLSYATSMGSIQVPESGVPILLMADCQTTGGYPNIAMVISADLALAGQLAPGDWIEFIFCNRRSAIEALSFQEQAFEM